MARFNVERMGGGVDLHARCEEDIVTNYDFRAESRAKGASNADGSWYFRMRNLSLVSPGKALMHQRC